jgi:hypothetical protein
MWAVRLVERCGVPVETYILVSNTQSICIYYVHLLVFIRKLFSLFSNVEDISDNSAYRFS